MQITSTKNPQIKHIKLLQTKSKQRAKEGSFVVEGVREISMALKFGYQIQKIFISDDSYDADLKFAEQTEIIHISSRVYQDIAYRSTTEGIIALCKSKPHQLENLKLKSLKPLVIVLESPEKPGNIGAVLRTADASAVDAVIIANPRTDVYNPNTIRASLGALFSVQIAIGTSDEIIQYFDQNSIYVYTATLQNSNSYLEHNYQNATAFVMGSEAKGLTQIWRDQPKFKAINIPMQGEIDSMNLSVSTAILTFEAVRQRFVSAQQPE